MKRNKSTIIIMLMLGMVLFNNINCVGGSEKTLTEEKVFDDLYEKERSKLNWAYTATEKYFKCTLPGYSPVVDWLFNWGLLGVWCDPAALKDYYQNVEGQILSRYSSLIIPERKSSWTTRKPLIAKMIKVLVVTTEIVLNERDLLTSFSALEKQNLLVSLIAKLIQESSISMYKRINGDLKTMRGDYGHGHGISQIDDRYHFVQLFENNVTWDLLSNISYGLNFFLDKWELVKSKNAQGKVPCINATANTNEFYHQLARSTYSLYNAGSFAKVCRWTNSEDRWYQNDVGYEAKFAEAFDYNKRASYMWEIVYSQAKLGVTDIDFVSILNIAHLPGDGNGTFPESNHDYANSLNETKQYSVSGATSLSVTFDALTFSEQGYDFIHILDGDMKDILGSPFTGAALANQTLIISGNKFYVRLISDSSVAKWGYKVTNVEAVVNETYPESIHNYTNNLVSEKTFTKSGAQALSIIFDARTSVESNYDFIHISDKSGKAIAGSPFTGKSLAGKTVVIVGDTINIKLTSDYSVVQWGYKISSITSTSATPPPTLTYPESVHNYANDSYEVKSFTINGASSISVSFDDLTEVEQGYDTISVTTTNGTHISGSPFTGTALAGKTVVVSGDTVKITLTSDYSIAKWGYKVTNVSSN